MCEKQMFFVVNICRNKLKRKMSKYCNMLDKTRHCTRMRHGIFFSSFVIIIYICARILHFCSDLEAQIWRNIACAHTHTHTNFSKIFFFTVNEKRYFDIFFAEIFFETRYCIKETSLLYNESSDLQKILLYI